MNVAHRRVKTGFIIQTDALYTDSWKSIPKFRWYNHFSLNTDVHTALGCIQLQLCMNVKSGCLLNVNDSINIKICINNHTPRVSQMIQNIHYLDYSLMTTYCRFYN